MHLFSLTREMTVFPAKSGKNPLYLLKNILKPLRKDILSYNTPIKNLPIFPQKIPDYISGDQKMVKW